MRMIQSLSRRSTCRRASPPGPGHGVRLPRVGAAGHARRPEAQWEPRFRRDRRRRRRRRDGRGPDAPRCTGCGPSCSKRATASAAAATVTTPSPLRSISAASSSSRSYPMSSAARTTRSTICTSPRAARTCRACSSQTSPRTACCCPMPSKRRFMTWRRAVGAELAAAGIAAQLGAPDMSVTDATADLAGQPWYTLTTAFLGLAFNVPTSQMSVLDAWNDFQFAINPDGSPSDKVNPTGMGNFVAQFASGLDIRLSTRVTEIDLTGADRITVVTDQGPLTAKAVIVTVPVTLLAAGEITFRPRCRPRTRRRSTTCRSGSSTRSVSPSPRTSSATCRPTRSSRHTRTRTRPSSAWGWPSSPASR